MCRLVRLANVPIVCRQNFNFFVRWEKNKKHSVGQRLGLDAVQLQYGLYVFGHLSKWFVFVLMFNFWSVCRLVNGRPTIGYNG